MGVLQTPAVPLGYAATREESPLWGSAVPLLNCQEAATGIEPVMGVLQTPAVPLGYAAQKGVSNLSHLTLRQYVTI